MEKRFELGSVAVIDIVDAVMGYDEIASLPDDVQFKLRLCIEEMIENIASYSKATWVEVRVNAEDLSLAISMEDDGTPFDPLAKDDPDIDAPLEERSIGGLGIFLCKKMMDAIEYECKDGHNILVLKKSLK